MGKFIEEFYYGNLDPQARRRSRTRQFKSKWKY